jgi:hypothetical protein
MLENRTGHAHEGEAVSEYMNIPSEREWIQRFRDQLEQANARITVLEAALREISEVYGKRVQSSSAWEQGYNDACVCLGSMADGALAASAKEKP